MARSAAGTIHLPAPVRKPPRSGSGVDRGHLRHRRGEPGQLAQRAAQRLGHLAGRLIALLRLLEQAAADDVDDVRRNVGAGDVDQRRVDS